MGNEQETDKTPRSDGNSELQDRLNGLLKQILIVKLDLNRTLSQESLQEYKTLILALSEEIDCFFKESDRKERENNRNIIRTNSFGITQVKDRKGNIIKKVSNIKSYYEAINLLRKEDLLLRRVLRENNLLIKEVEKRRQLS